ncbi:translocation/assembly module TamB domain-containing protein [Aliiroseovarius subalbicans]|uniref:translocation/assembly module TamB domain-containing protein n=1 Tax=Aliiroseovarius subalbicans TaxID=2925840 RepID=UPI001F5786D2|nr:translocation/assembly module TamB domain-containing protein [Aliiroseovarius subalbicans]MCI2400238.1 translocation/assembly module TamB domain-containing protein [Aliiroseovarius subalbicans]
MNRVCPFLSALVLLVLALPVMLVAQSDDSPDDRGYLQAWLEDNLSDAGREVRIVGFVGALSAQASLDELTIADDDGVWLTLRDVVLNWNRAALLTGRLDITRLSAAEILLPRAPVPADAIPDPEASSFALPALPVGIEIQEVRADRVVLGQELFGAAATVTLQGAAQLESGSGQATLTATRIDGPEGALTFTAAYNATTQDIDLSLALIEQPDGIAANLLNLPGRPSVRLEVDGSGALDNFAASIALNTDGERRLSGQVKVSGATGAQDNTTGTRRFAAQLGGDIAPLFLPEYRDFFGDDIRLALTGEHNGDGEIRLEDLSLGTDALRLDGQAALAPGGWPTRIALSGRIARPEGSAVLLPLSGAQTRVQSADLALNFDAATDDSWRANFSAAELSREGFEVETMVLEATGQLLRESPATLGQVLGSVTAQARGLNLGTPALAKAFGRSLEAGFDFDWSQSAPLAFSELEVTGESFGLTGKGQVQGATDLFDLSVTGDARLTTTDLSQFSGLTGQTLTGEATLEAEGNVLPLSGGFTLVMTGEGHDIAIGQAQVDAVLAGPSRLSATARRDEAGTNINRFSIATDHATVAASATLAAENSSVSLTADIPETAILEHGTRGPAALSLAATQVPTGWSVTLDATAPGGTKLEAKGLAELTHATLTRVSGSATATIATLAPFSKLAGRPLSGALDLTIGGAGDPGAGAFQAELTATGQDLGLGTQLADRLLRGGSRVTSKIQRGDDGLLVIRELELATPEVMAKITGSISPDTTALTFNTKLRDLGVVAPGVTGPAEAEGTAKLSGNAWQVSANGTGPGASMAQVTGQVLADGTRADLEITGSAPLALANAFVAPNRVAGPIAFDLSLNGPFALSSLSGQATTKGARLALPAQQLTLSPLTATVRFTGEQARIEAQGVGSGGGNLRVTGPVVLTPPYAADLAIELNALGLSDARLYDTTVDGQVTLRGPLSGGASISADLTLGPTELQVPESSLSVAPVLANLEHLNEPGQVRQTRVRAGLLATEDGGGTGRAWPLDITLRAPSRVFVRGRGLDAELGGQVQVTGSTTNVVTQGRFDLIRGRLDILGKRLTMTEGYAQLRGSFDPVLRLVASTRADDTDVRVIVEGPASAPEITFSSSPELPEDEVLARLLFGRDLTKISPLQAVQLAAAVQTLAGGNSGLLNRVRAQFGLDDLDVTTEQDGTTQARAGKYITENIYTDITIGSDGRSEINLNLNISPSFTARGSAASDGESSVGVFFERDY